LTACKLILFPLRCMSRVSQKRLQIEDCWFQFRCRRCSTRLSKNEKGVLVNRVLPLPSLAWKELSTDWFCGCGQHNQMKNKGHTHGDHHENDHSSMTYKLLHSSPGGTVLFAPGVVVLPLNDLDEAEMMSKNGVVLCGSCGRELGRAADDTGSRRFYDHAVALTTGHSRVEDMTAAHTFADLVLAALRDCHPAGAPRIVLAGPSKVVTVWSVEQELKTYFGSESLAPHSGFQVLWKAGASAVATMEINVTDEVVNAACHALASEQYWWLTTDGNASGYNIGWLSFIDNSSNG